MKAQQQQQQQRGAASSLSATSMKSVGAKGTKTHGANMTKTKCWMMTGTFVGVFVAAMSMTSDAFAGDSTPWKLDCRSDYTGGLCVGSFAGARAHPDASASVEFLEEVLFTDVFGLFDVESVARTFKARTKESILFRCDFRGTSAAAVESFRRAAEAPGFAITWDDTGTCRTLSISHSSNNQR